LNIIIQQTLKIYIRTIKHYTDIDPTVDFVFTVIKKDRENSEQKKFLRTICSYQMCIQRL